MGGKPFFHSLVSTGIFSVPGIAPRSGLLLSPLVRGWLEPRSGITGGVYEGEEGEGDGVEAVAAPGLGVVVFAGLIPSEDVPPALTPNMSR